MVTQIESLNKNPDCVVVVATVTYWALVLIATWLKVCDCDVWLLLTFCFSCRCCCGCCLLRQLPFLSVPTFASSQKIADPLKLILPATISA